MKPLSLVGLVGKPRPALVGKSHPGRSLIGAPLTPPESDASPAAAPERPAPDPADLSSFSPSAPPLSPECDALRALLPAGMALRAMGAVAGDRQAIFDHWMALGEEGRRMRFFYSASEWTLRQRAATLDFSNPRFAGILDADGRLACLAEWAREGPREAEAAFSTSLDRRRMGLAKIAAGACAIDARAQGVARLRVDTLRENVAAQGLAASLGGGPDHSEPREWGSVSVSSYIDLRAAGARSIEARLGIAPASERAAA